MRYYTPDDVDRMVRIFNSILYEQRRKKIFSVGVLKSTYVHTYVGKLTSRGSGVHSPQTLVSFVLDNLSIGTYIA